MVKYIGILLISLSLAGCGLGPVKIPKKNYYAVEYQSNAPVINKKRTKFSIAIAEPKSAMPYKTKGMYRLNSEKKISVIPNVLWVATPPKMLQPALVNAVRDMGYFKYVVPLPYPAKVDFVLRSQIMQLINDQDQIKFSIAIQLIKSGTGETKMIQTYQLAMPQTGQDPQAYVQAVNLLVNQMLRDLQQRLVSVRLN